MSKTRLIRLSLLLEHRLVTDRHRQTDTDTGPQLARALAQRRAGKSVSWWLVIRPFFTHAIKVVVHSVVSVLGRRVSRAKMAEQIEMSFEWDSCGSKEPSIVWGPDPSRERELLRRHVAGTPRTMDSSCLGTRRRLGQDATKTTQEGCHAAAMQLRTLNLGRSSKQISNIIRHLWQRIQSHINCSATLPCKIQIGRTAVTITV